MHSHTAHTDEERNTGRIQSQNSIGNYIQTLIDKYRQKWEAVANSCLAYISLALRLHGTKGKTNSLALCKCPKEAEN